MRIEASEVAKFVFPHLTDGEREAVMPVYYGWFMADPVDAANEAEALVAIFDMPNAEELFRARVRDAKDTPRRVREAGDVLLSIRPDVRRTTIGIMADALAFQVRAKEDVMRATFGDRVRFVRP